MSERGGATVLPERGGAGAGHRHGATMLAERGGVGCWPIPERGGALPRGNDATRAGRCRHRIIPPRSVSSFLGRSVRSSVATVLPERGGVGCWPIAERGGASSWGDGVGAVSGQRGNDATRAGRCIDATRAGRYRSGAVHRCYQSGAVLYIYW